MNRLNSAAVWLSALAAFAAVTVQATARDVSDIPDPKTAGVSEAADLIQLAQAGGPPARRHTANQRGELSLFPANMPPITAGEVSISVNGALRLILSNGISTHDTGAFPNAANPNAIAEQRVRFTIPVAPEVASSPTFYQLGTFGVAVNGVIFEPQAAEWYLGERGSQWQYDPLGGAVPLGLDTNNAHVQPNGAYHYHGTPSGLLDGIGVTAGTHSPVAGWALDGFPIYALYGSVDDGEVRELRSSWQVKSGARPAGGSEPGGIHDGTFVADYDYVEGSGDLDICNGRMVETPEFPDGTYAYFITRTFPVIPRCFSGTPISGAVVMNAAGQRVN